MPRSCEHDMVDSEMLDLGKTKCADVILLGERMKGMESVDGSRIPVFTSPGKGQLPFSGVIFIANFEA